MKDSSLFFNKTRIEQIIPILIKYSSNGRIKRLNERLHLKQLFFQNKLLTNPALTQYLRQSSLFEAFQKNGKETLLFNQKKDDKKETGFHKW